MKLRVGNKLLNIREERKATQDEMAQILNMSTSSYARLERGETALPFEEMTRISQILNVPIHEFLPDTVSFQHNATNSQQSGLIFGNIYNYYDRTEYTKELELKIKQLENENLFLRQRLAGGAPEN